MNIDKVYLFLSVVYGKTKSESKTDWTFSLSSLFDGEIYHSDFNGVISGSSRKTKLSPEIKNEFWKSNVEEIFLYGHQSINQNTYLTLCYLLKSTILHELFFNTGCSKDIRSQRDMLSELVIETFPDLTEMAKLCYQQNKDSDKLPSKKKLLEYKLLLKNLFEANSYEVGHTIGSLDSFLIVVPSNNEIEKLGIHQESVSNFLLRFESSINRIISDTVYVPYYYWDFIETMDNFYSFKNSILRVIICTKPNGDKNEVVIPNSIRNIIDFEIKIHVLKSVKTNLEHVYANREDIQDYIASISEKNIFKNYTSKFQNERLKYFQTKFEIEEIISEYKSVIQNSFPYFLKNYYDTHLIKDVSRAEELYSWSFLEKRINEFDNLVSSIEFTLKTVETKDSFINAYLSNIIAIESTWTNLKLQKTLKKLTFIAITIATLSIFILLYSTEIKSLIKDLLLPLIKYL